MCPADCRPFDGYALSSNGTFEFCRFELEWSCSVLCFNRPELYIYKTQYKYQDINDHFIETLIGKVVPRMTVNKRKIDIYYAGGNKLGS